MSPTIWSIDAFFKIGLCNFLNDVSKQFPTTSNLLFIDLNHLPKENTLPEDIKIDTIVFIIENNGDKYLLNEKKMQCIKQSYQVRFILRKFSLSDLKKFMVTIAKIPQADYVCIKHYTFTIYEKKLLSMIAAGLSVSSISYNCRISPQTVSYYKRKIMRKININSSSVFFRKLVISHNIEHVLSALTEENHSNMINNLLLNRFH